MDEVADNIEDNLALERHHWLDLPSAWAPRQHIGSASVVWSSSYGYSFDTPGDAWTWRVSVGASCHLLSDGTMKLSAGYALDHLFGGNSTREMGGPRPWMSSGTAPTGTPTCIELARRLAQELHDNLAPTMEMFERSITR